MKKHVFGNSGGGDDISGNVIFYFSSKQSKSLKRCKVMYKDSESY